MPSALMQMLACVDVDYRDAGAVAACVCFQAWSAGTSASEYVVQVRDVEPYRSGQFYRRELPCILTVLRSLPELPHVVIVDGYVWLCQHQPGLGAHLYEALARRAAVVGVAKTRYAPAEPAAVVLRGCSRSPLYVTAAGMDVAEAARRVRTMHGPYRIPTLLKRVDQLSRKQEAPADRGIEPHHRRRTGSRLAFDRKGVPGQIGISCGVTRWPAPRPPSPDKSLKEEKP